MTERPAKELQHVAGCLETLGMRDRSRYTTSHLLLMTCTAVIWCVSYRMGSEALWLRDRSHKGFGPIPVLGTDAWRAFLVEEHLRMGGARWVATALPGRQYNLIHSTSR